MGNKVHLSTKLQLFINTDYSQEQAAIKFHPDNIVDVIVYITLSDGSVHKTSYAEFTSLTQEFFESQKKKPQTN